MLPSVVGAWAASVHPQAVQDDRELLASATFARLMPRRLATSRAQRLSVEKRPLRVSMT